MTNNLFLSGGQILTRALLIGFVLLACAFANGQNFVRNPDFEEPLGPDNWTVEYAGVTGTPYIHQPTNSGPNDFKVKGRTAFAHRDLGKIIGAGTWDGGEGGSTNYWNKFGAQFEPNHTWLMHAYFKQVVTNLNPSASYACSAWMALFDPSNTNIDKLQVYMETLGGTDLTTSRRTIFVTDNSHNNPGGWKKYTVTNTASSDGKIELRLHFIKIKTSGNWSYRQINAFYDHVAVVPAGQTEYMPPYQITSLTRSNNDVTLKWNTVMNNRYRIQYSTNASDAMAWWWVGRDPGLDTNFFALGTNFTFKTNLLSMFASDPTFDPTRPLFFRIQSTDFRP